MLAHILVIDDMFGRIVSGGRNPDRGNLCAHFLWRDVTDDAAARSSRQTVLRPVANAVFYRGQTPAKSDIGAVVENDLAGSLLRVRLGWIDAIATGHPPWTLILLDLCFYTGRVTEESHLRTPGMPEGREGDDDRGSYFGLSLLDAIHRQFPDCPIFILSSKPREEVSLEFSHRGALGFIDRSDPRAPELVEEAIWNHGLLADPAGKIAGNSLPMLLALREARRAARHRKNILIRGERGTGKELIARYVHTASLHAPGAEGKGDRPFVVVNSAVFTPNLFASELFGIQPRTATGVEGKPGLIESANGGDLFLDEIADMPTEVQAAMLRVLQERQISPVGSRAARDVDVRFLSATNEDLEKQEAGFRADLLDRLRMGGTLWLPPLRERLEDLSPLAERFVRQAESQTKGALKRDITAEAMELLRSHDWPGNVRELESCIADAVNRYPDVEHMVRAHLRIGQEGPAKQAKIIQHDSALKPLEKLGRPISELNEFLSLVDAFRFDPVKVDQWSGSLNELQRAFSKVFARYLASALTATMRRTPAKPNGQIQIHPAVKLMTGDATMTASNAADVIKRILGPLEDELDGDLREALAIAIRLRPRSGKSAQRVE